MYVTTYAELMQELDARERSREEARDRVNSFIRRRYGVEDGLGAMRTHFGIPEEGPATAVLARQIASVCAEDAAFELGTSLMGLPSLTATFVRDSFSTQNHDKVHRVKIPWISWSKKGNMMTRYEHVAQNSHLLGGTALDAIRCADGTPLPDYHLGLRAKARSPGRVADVSDLHLFMLMNATYPPREIYREEEGRQRLVSRMGCMPLTARDRPNAAWYYPYYLSWFVDGSMILFETYENPDSCVPLIQAEFERDMKEVLDETGFLPLVVKIPPLTKRLLSCNEHLLESNAFAELKETLAPPGPQDTVSYFASIAESVIRFH